MTYPVPTLRRLIKYTNQGFTACSGCLQALVEGARAAPTPLLETRYID